jgi:PAS domain S-box-containing protein
MSFVFYALMAQFVMYNGDAVAIVDESGQPVRMLGTLLDITERKLAEQAIQESEARYRAITGLVADYAYTAVITPDNSIISTWMTDSLQELTGIQLNDADALSIWQQMTYPEDADLAEEVLRRVLSGHEDVVEMRLRLADGRVKWIRHYILPVWSREEGRVVQIHGAIQDITPYKELEMRLRQAQKMEAVGQLAGGVAHDFNNVLTAIMNYTDLLLLYFPNEEDKVHERLQQIAQSADRAAKLTHQLLAFSRKQVLTPTIVNLNEVVSNMLKMVSRLIGEDVVCVTQLADDLSQVKADRGQLEQVILNLVVNARDALPGGGEVLLQTADIHIEQTISNGYTDIPPGHYVLLSVSDTGMGMDSTTQLRIFEPFFTTKEQGKGTGLGLATVHGIVKQSGGHISVRSQVGQGTTFAIYLPRVIETADSLASSKNANQTLYGTETILVVEDELFVRESVRDSLIMYGYRVLDVVAEEVVMVCQQFAEPIHLVLTDIVMPGLNGREVAEQVKQLRPHTKILFMSGYTDDKILQHGALNPTVPFLQKPFTPDVLVQKVRQVLDG